MLQLEKVGKNYESKEGIRDINLVFHEGEITGILGRNGSGKTTLLKCILDLLQPEQGRILFNDQPVYQQQDKVAFISEEGSYMPNMKMKEYGNFLKGYYPSFDVMQYQNLLKKFELEDHTLIREHSKGQKMKIEIAAGFSMHAKLIILDEPFNGLDVYAKEDNIKLLIEQLHDDTIILISTHNIEEIEQVADRCILLDHGTVKRDLQMDTLHEDGLDLKELMDQYK